MSAKSKGTLQVISGWAAVELIIQCFFIGAWQLLKIAFKKLWRGHKRKVSKKTSTVQKTVDSSIGTHCYIKVLGVKYHCVETGPPKGEVVLVLGDAPKAGTQWCTGWKQVVSKLANSGRRVVSLDLRGTGGSEGGTAADLAPPRAVEELHAVLQSLDVSDSNPAIIIGHGVGGMLTWYLVHCHPSLVKKFVVIGAPHPNLYWQYPVASFCQNILHFMQWPYLPERWLAEDEMSQDNTESCDNWSSRACDWSGALNYIRGAAWWRVRSGRVVPSAGLLVGAHKDGAMDLVASARYCAAPTLRLVQSANASAPDLPPILLHFLLGDETAEEKLESEGRSGGLMGRMLGAVAGRGRELTAAVSRLSLPAPDLHL